MTEPFETVEDAWFWTMGALASRRDGASSSAASVPRPCEPDDVVKALDGLYRQRRIDLMHAHILRIYGERQVRPDAEKEAGDLRLWREAMTRLEWPLRVKGIVKGSVP
jgi:hypothetical protein